MEPTDYAAFLFFASGSVFFLFGALYLGCCFFDEIKNFFNNNNDGDPQHG